MKPRLLDLFCGAGGAAMGYHRAGFEVVGVDIKPQPHYPFEFHQADALTYPLDGFDVYHASPPCQAYSMMQHVFKNKDEHPDLIVIVRQKLEGPNKPFVIENVYKAPLKATLLLCGSMFGLKTIRHRYFEFNGWLPLLLQSPCNHEGAYSKWRWRTNPGASIGEKEKLAESFGIDWFMTRSEVREAIPPAYTEYIGKELMKALIELKEGK